MRKWLRAFAYRTDLDLGLFIGAGLLTVVAAALPIVYQSLKAALADPIKALRSE
jgi:putative ABC transport system permease protein